MRQNLRDAGEDNKNLLLGFEFGGIPSVNSLRSIYGFQVSLKHKLNRIKNNRLTKSIFLAGQALDIQSSPSNTKKSRERKFSTNRTNLLSKL